MHKKTEVVIVYAEQLECSAAKVRWQEVLISLFLILGILWNLMAGKTSNTCQMAVLLETAVIITIYSLLNNENNKIIEIILLGICMAAVFMNITTFLNALFFMVNQWISCWNTNFDQYHSLLAAGNCQLLDEIRLWSVIGIFLVLLISWMLRTCQLNILSLVVSVVVAADFLTGTVENIGFVILCISWIAALHFIFSNKRSLFKTFFYIAALAFSVMIVLMFLLRFYQPQQAVAGVKERIQTDIHTLRYGSDKLPKGDLYLADKMLTESKNTLLINTDQPGALYLRGFVGGKYEGSSWQELSGAVYTGEQNGMLDWLQTQNFYPALQFGNYQNLLNEAEGASQDQVYVTIHNTGADREYIYLPTTGLTTDAGNMQYKYDWQIRSGYFFGSKNYSATAYSLPVIPENQKMDAAVENSTQQDVQMYVKSENIYSTFVNENYLEVPEDIKSLIEDTFYKDSNINLETAPTATITSRIRTVLKANISYQKVPDNFTGDEDYISWLLNKTRSGNSVAFSSIAVIAYRMAGIPARYTEGYYLSEDKAKTASDSSEGVQLTDKDGHAWVEIYVDGLGWTAVDVTPGFYKDDQQANTLLELSEDVNQGGQQNDNYYLIEQYNNSQVVQPDSKLEKNIKLFIAAVIVLIILIVIIVVVILELQRRLRIYMRKKAGRQNPDEYTTKEEVCYYYDEICKLWTALGIKETYTMPYKIKPILHEKIPSIREEQIDRVLSLIQKVVFGEMELRPHELRAIKAFYKKLRREVCKRGGLVQRFKNRYWYCI